LKNNFDVCPICKNELKEHSIRTEDHGKIYHFDCRYCGKYQLFGWRMTSRYGLEENHDTARKTADSILCIAIRMNFEKTKKEVYVDHVTIPELKKTVVEPDNPLEKVDLLLEYLHQRNHDFTKEFTIPIYDYPLIYARSITELDAIFSFAEELKLLKLHKNENKILRNCKLTEEGWKKISAISSAKIKELTERNTSSTPKHIQCFIVHGQDAYRRNVLKNFLIEIDITPIILHEQPSRGDSVTEKFEYFSEMVDFAICLWTGDDRGCKKGENCLSNRVRQNVMLETGFFWGKLKRKKTIILYSNDVEIPSDLKGVIYIAWDRQWRDRIRNEISNMVFG